MKIKNRTGEWIDLSDRGVKNGYQLLPGDPMIPVDLLSSHDDAALELFVRRMLEEQGVHTVSIFREGDE